MAEGEQGRKGTRGWGRKKRGCKKGAGFKRGGGRGVVEWCRVGSV